MSSAVSANLDGLPSHHMVGSVAVIGVAGGEPFGDPVDAVQALVSQLDSDVVVVLAHEVGRRARDLARIPGVDVLIEAGGYSEHYPPMWEGEAVWVRSVDQTMALGELRLRIDEGRVVAARERQIDLDDRIPSDPALKRLERRTADDVDGLQRALYQ